MHHLKRWQFALMAGLLGLTLAGCGTSATKEMNNQKTVNFAQDAQSKTPRIWYETTGSNVASDSKVAYIIVTQNGKGTVYRTSNYTLPNFYHKSDSQIIALAKRLDKRSYTLKRDAAYAENTSTYDELAQTLHPTTTRVPDPAVGDDSSSADSSSESVTMKPLTTTEKKATKFVMSALKDRRLKIESAQYQKPMPQPLKITVTKKHGQVVGEQMVYRHHDYDSYFAQLADSSTWAKQYLKSGQLATIRPMSDYFVTTEGSPVVYKHLTKKPLSIVDQYVGYLEKKQTDDDDDAKNAGALLTRTSNDQSVMAFDQANTTGVTVKK